MLSHNVDKNISYVSNRNPANIARAEIASEIHVQNRLNMVSLSQNQVVKSIIIINTSSAPLADHSPSTISTMSDKDAAPVPSSPPPAPTGNRPKVTNRGRSTDPISSSNSDSTEVPEFEPFVAPGPRGYPPLTGEGLH